LGQEQSCLFVALYPPVETTPEGGAYSVNIVANRIMTMVKSIAGDDPNKLQQIIDVVEKGFSQVGLDFNIYVEYIHKIATKIENSFPIFKR
jgi:hypothetical protein